MNHRTLYPRLAVLICASLISCASSLLAQTERTVRILFLNGPAEAPEKIHLHASTDPALAGAAQEVELPRLNLSPPYVLPAGDITLSLAPQALPADQAAPATSPKIQVPATTNEFYLLLAHDPTNKDVPMRMQIIPANPDSFQKGQMLWYNLTSTRVGGQVGSKKLDMKPQSRAILDAPASGNEDYNVNLSYYIAGRQDLYPLCETKWTHDPRSRSIYFIINQPGSRAPRVMGFPDYRETEKKPE